MLVRKRSNGTYHVVKSRSRLFNHPSPDDTIQDFFYVLPYNRKAHYSSKGIIGCSKMFFPPNMIGKRVKINIEVLDD